ncbi:MAG: hypothetical protein ACOC2F_05135 [Bacteroidota bacterium]
MEIFHQSGKKKWIAGLEEIQLLQGEQGTPWQQHENLDKNLIENKTVLTKIT